jgi:predicted glycoside hydrolase/deacetylase ChbG (UPF0249 family)
MIVINSDDFGLSPEVNKAIYLAFQKKLISSTSTLVNFEEGLQDAVIYFAQNKIDPKSVGIHLNLTEGLPLTEGIQKSRLCKDGQFKKGNRAAPIFSLDHSTKQSVYKELDAQINRFIEKFGFFPSHIDSHHHIHTEWAIMQCVIDLAKKHQIKSIRLARNIGFIDDYKKHLYRTLLNRFLRFKGLEVTCKFGDLDDIILSGLVVQKDYEIMVHAQILATGKPIVDLDGNNLQQKIVDAFGDNQVQLVNYTEYRNTRT